jgi:hypothetical protein
MPSLACRVLANAGILLSLEVLEFAEIASEQIPIASTDNIDEVIDL